MTRSEGPSPSLLFVPAGMAHGAGRTRRTRLPRAACPWLVGRADVPRAAGEADHAHGAEDGAGWRQKTDIPFRRALRVLQSRPVRRGAGPVGQVGVVRALGVAAFEDTAPLG